MPNSLLFVVHQIRSVYRHRSFCEHVCLVWNVFVAGVEIVLRFQFQLFSVTVVTYHLHLDCAKGCEPDLGLTC
jgi:hypothetical protein